MSRALKAIDGRSVHQICSGQVVLTLAMAVKELVENSVDAGANNIEVRLKEYGSEAIEVSDNGSGVNEIDFESLTLKHHTSKLQKFSDLLTVSTFGFRGEALSSLCALSKLTVTTCHKDAEIGTRLEYDHDGKLIKQSPIARPVGTTVMLEDLFSTLPVRYKEFHRNLKKEFAKMVQILTAYCLISTGARISCVNTTNKGKKTVVLSTNGESNIKNHITSLFGYKQVNSLVEFVQYDPSVEILEEFFLTKAGETAFKIEGYISVHTHGEGRSATDRQFFFINGRPCDLPKAAKVLNDVYHSYNRYQYPFICLDIKVDEGIADVNVTPDKRLILVAEEKTLLAILKTSLSTMYENEPLTTKHFSSPLIQSTLKFDSNQDVCKPPLANASPISTNMNERKLSNKRSFFTTMISKEEKEIPVVIDEENTMIDVAHSQDKIDASSSLESGNCLDANHPTTSQISGLSSILSKTLKEDIIKSFDSPQSQFLKNISQFMRPTNKFKTGNVKSPRKKKMKTQTDAIQDDFDIDFIIQKHKQDLGKFDVDNSSEITDVQQTDSGIVEQSVNELSTETNINVPLDEVEDICVDKPSSRKRNVVMCEVSMDLIREKLKNTGNKKDAGCGYRKFRSKLNATGAEDELRKEFRKDMFAQMEIIGQFNLGFIIAKMDEDLFIIDQHASDEKFNYEMLQQDTILETQQLISAQNLQLTAISEATLLDNLHIFEVNGFQFEVNEDESVGQKVQLISVPVSRNWSFGKGDIDELIFMLTDNPGRMCRPSRISQMFASRACRKSVMIGTALSRPLMKKLVCHMGEMEHPWNCPHGRPTMRHLLNLRLLDT